MQFKFDHRTVLSSLTLVACIAIPGVVRADEPPPQKRYAETADHIIQSCLAENDSWKKMEELCDDIGNRLSGSPSLDKAIAWAAKTLKADGQENVHTEHVMVPKWVRGRESLEMVKPREFTLVLIGLGGSVGTPAEGLTAPVIVVEDEDGLERVKDQVKGKIVLFNNPMPEFDPGHGAGYGTTVRFRGKGPALVAKLGGLACLVRSVTACSLRSPHTGATHYEDGVEKIPAAAVSTEDAGMIARLTARNKEVVVTLKMEARMEGEAPSANVIAELRGSEKPEEIVVIGGHIDSWDVGHGAQDDGAGCVIAMEALNVLRRLEVRPRRTIRVVLFTNEENGLRGGTQYAEDHADELANHVAAIEADSGAFQPVGYSVQFEDKERQTRAVEQLSDIVQLLKPLNATDVTSGHSGADIGPMKSAGVPLLGFRVEGSKYFNYHHSRADTLDKIDPDDLTHCVASMAVMSYILADMPGRLGDPIEPPAPPSTH